MAPALRTINDSVGGILARWHHTPFKSNHDQAVPSSHGPGGCALPGTRSYTFTPFQRRETELPGFREPSNPDVVSLREEHRDLVHPGRLRGGVENDPDHLVRHRSRVGGPWQQD